MIIYAIYDDIPPLLVSSSSSKKNNKKRNKKFLLFMDEGGRGDLLNINASPRGESRWKHTAVLSLSLWQRRAAACRPRVYSEEKRLCFFLSLLFRVCP